MSQCNKKPLKYSNAEYLVTSETFKFRRMSFPVWLRAAGEREKTDVNAFYFVPPGKGVHNEDERLLFITMLWNDQPKTVLITKGTTIFVDHNGFLGFR